MTFSKAYGLVFALIIGVSLFGNAKAAKTDFEIELDSIELRVAQIQGRPWSIRGARELVMQMITRAKLTGRLTHYREAHATLKYLDPQDSDSKLIRAFFMTEIHQISQAEAMLKGFAKNDAKAARLRLGVNRQKGIQGLPTNGIDPKSPGTFSTWDQMAEKGWAQWLAGRPELADQLYDQAQRLAQNLRPRYLAWLELQRGIIDLELKRYRQAQEHFKKANQMYSGYWLVEEHLAETHALLGNKQKALQLYRKAVPATQNPELFLAWAELENGETQKKLKIKADDWFKAWAKEFPTAIMAHYLEYLMNSQQSVIAKELWKTWSKTYGPEMSQLKSLEPFRETEVRNQY